MSPAWSGAARRGAVVVLFVALLLGPVVPPELTAVLPATVPKLAGGQALLTWLLTAGIEGRSWLPRTVATVPATLGLVVMGAWVTASPDLVRAGRAWLAVALLVAMIHVVPALLRTPDLVAVARALAAVLVVLALGTLTLGAVPAGAVDVAWTHRPAGTLRDANLWATALLAVGAPLMAVLSADQGRGSRSLRLALWVVVPACVLQSLSRAGTLVLLPWLAGLLWVERGRWRPALGAAALGLVLASTTIPWSSATLRFQALADPSVEVSVGHASLARRADLLFAGAALVRERPVVGYVLESFPREANRIVANPAHHTAHDTWLLVWVEQGVVGLFAWLGVGARVGAATLTAAAGVAGPGRALARGGVVGLGALAAMSLVLDLLRFPLGWFALALCLAAAHPVTVHPQRRGPWPTKAS